MQVYSGRTSHSRLKQSEGKIYDLTKLVALQETKHQVWSDQVAGPARIQPRCNLRRRSFACKMCGQTNMGKRETFQGGAPLPLPVNEHPGCGFVLLQEKLDFHGLKRMQQCCLKTLNIIDLRHSALTESS